MNVTDTELRNYIKIFIKTLEETAQQYLPKELQKNLLHLSLLPSKITGYVSTQFGVAIEYTPSANPEIVIVRGSARVEDLFIQAPTRLRDTGPMFSIGGADTGIYKLTLSGAFPFRLTRTQANVSIGDVQFEAGQWKRLIHFAEVFGDRSCEMWSLEKAVSRAKDEVLAAMIEVKRADEKHVSISEYIDQFKMKTVLVLGDYDEAGLARLQNISRCLAALGYEPLLIKDIPDHPHQDLPQKVVAIGAISRFVVVDDSSKSGHLLEVQICKQNSWVTVLLRAGGQGGSWMSAGAAHLSNVILEKPYDPDFPDVAVTEVSEWSESKLKELQVKFDSTYPWRANS